MKSANDIDNIQETTFRTSRMEYHLEDPKFTKFRSKKIKMSDSFLEAKSKCQTQISDFTDTSSTSKMLNGLTLTSDTKKLRRKGAKGRFVCKTDGCFKSFTTRKDMRRHKLCHRVRKHVCPMKDCGRAFYEKSKLKRHMVVHTKKKEYSCKICGKKFGYKANVKTHMRTHTGERPFTCRVEGCEKSFAQASNRNAHEKTHYKTEEDREKLKFIDDDESVENNSLDSKRKLDLENSEQTSIRRSTRIQTKENEKLQGLPLSLFWAQTKDENISEEQNPLDFDTLVGKDYDPFNKHKTLFGDAPPLNLLFNSFTSISSGLFQDSDFLKDDLGLSLDALEQDDLFSNHESLQQKVKDTDMPKIKESVQDLPSIDIFDEEMNSPDLSTSKLSSYSKK